MIWSKSKKALESLLADSVKAHVQYHITRYGPGVSWFMRRAWITWDDKEIINMSNIEWHKESRTLSDQIRTINHVTDFRNPSQRQGYDQAGDQAEVIIQKQGILSRQAFENAIEQYLSLSIEDAILSENPIIKALALFDRRLGKRRLVKLEIATWDHPLVKQFYDLRCTAEGLRRSDTA